MCEVIDDKKKFINQCNFKFMIEQKIIPIDIFFKLIFYDFKI